MCRSDRGELKRLETLNLIVIKGMNDKDVGRESRLTGCFSSDDCGSPPYGMVWIDQLARVIAG